MADSGEMAGFQHFPSATICTLGSVAVEVLPQLGHMPDVREPV